LNKNESNIIKRKKLKKERLSVLKTKSRISKDLKDFDKNNEVLKEEIENNDKMDNYSLRISSVDEMIILYDRHHDNSFLSSTNENSDNKRNFSTDDLIYNILLISLEKLEEFCDYLTRESEMLKNIYLELSQDEKDNFFKKIHSIEVSLQLLSQETFLRRKFLKFANIKFKSYNKITKNFYFNKSFNFFIEIMIARLIQIELNFKKLKNVINMIKDNFNIVVDDNQEKEDNRLNDTMKILAILTAIFTPYQVITGIYGMNIKLPFGASSHSSFIPFFCVVFFLLFLTIIQIFIFRRWKWI
jgi:Mg2+ and Co2+ transporter CorA